MFCFEAATEAARSWLRYDPDLIVSRVASAIWRRAIRLGSSFCSTLVVVIVVVQLKVNTGPILVLEGDSRRVLCNTLYVIVFCGSNLIILLEFDHHPLLGHKDGNDKIPSTHHLHYSDNFNKHTCSRLAKAP